MPRTIVQEYGPIYGEPVNGTVLGRPNGSVFVPISNVVNLSIGKEYAKYISNNRIVVCDSDGTWANNPDYAIKVDALSQDLSSYIVVTAYTDEELTTVEASRTLTAGIFNYEVMILTNSQNTLSNGDPLYIVATLCNNGVPVATSDVIQLSMVVA